jgi:6-phosphogluconolactonase
MLAVALSLALFLTQMEPKVVKFYIGTYTTPNGSEGIYEAKLDLKTGSLAAPILVAKTNNPSFLAVARRGKNLYAVDESQEGSVSAYTIEESTVKLINKQPVEGSSPCYISVDPSGKNALVASYGGGVVSCFPLASDGALKVAASKAVETGSGPDKGWQDASHMHWVLADPSGRLIYTCDLGTDKVQAFPFDSSTGRISRSLQQDVKVPPGAGPRHGAWGAKGKFLYVANEMGSSVSVLKVNQSNGSLSLEQTISSVEKDPAPSNNTGAEIECHPSGKWIYVSNRGDDSVAVFRIQPSGDLERIQVKHLGVRVPRGFAIDPTGKWLIAAGQESNDLEALPIDKDGRLGKIKLSKPTCVAFLR